MVGRKVIIGGLLLFAGVLPFTVLAQLPSPPSGVVWFDRNPLVSFSATPTVSGGASNLSTPLTVSVFATPSGLAEKKVYENNSVSVSGGRWMTTISPAISNGQYRIEVSAGSKLLATSSMFIGLRSFPAVSLDPSLPVYDVADGRLMRFAVSAGSAGPVALAQLTFLVSSEEASTSGLTLTQYSDAAYSAQVGSSFSGIASPVDADTMLVTVAFSPVLIIPPESMSYFELDGAVQALDTGYTVTTTLLSDSATTTANTLPALSAAGAHVIWSPNTYGMATSSDVDWTNGRSVRDLPQDGLSYVRTGVPEMNPPTCTLAADNPAVTPGTTVLVSWSSTGATYALWSGHTMSVPASGAMSLVASSTQTLTLLFYGPYGVTPCSTTIVVAPTSSAPLAGSASSVVVPSLAATSSSSTGQFSATPTAGGAPLSVAFKGNVNTASACAAMYYFLVYGDGSSAQMTVAAKVCKPHSFTLSHTYAKAGSYLAALYLGKTSSISTTSAQLLQSQLIAVAAATSTKKVAATNANYLANIVSAWVSLTSLFTYIPTFLGW